MDRDPVVRPERLRLEPERVAEPDPDRHRPRRVHACSERGQQADPPVADLVAEALDDDRPVRRHRAGRVLLVAEEREKVPSSLLVERVLLGQALERLLLGESDELTRRAPDRLAQLVRTPGPLALPERDQPRHARSRRDEHPVARDLLDPPRRGAERERLSRARLVDHLLVQLPDASPAVDEVDAVEAAVRDRARVLDRELPRAAPTADHTAGAIPNDPRPELGELVGRIAAREHVEHVLELHAREVGEVVGAADEVVQLVDGDLLVGADRDDLLREHVERVARDDGLLDRARLHALDDDRRLEQVGAELREDAPARDRAQLVAGPTDPLEAARDRLGRLDLDDEVDRAHVDAELERRRGDEARDLALLQQLLDLDPLLAGDRAVMGSCDLALCEVVEPQREPLGEAPVVDEDDRRAVRLDELEDLRIDGRPDRAGLPRLAHVLERHHDLDVELLRATRVDELDRPATRDEAPDLLHRPLRRREADALNGPLCQAIEAFDRQRQVCAALRAGDRVHLVEDERLDRLQHLAAAGRKQQVERLRSRDQDVRVLAEHRGAVALRCVAGADSNVQLRAEPGERAAEVPLDVVVERLQRRDVEQAEALARGVGQPVDPVQECSERLPGACRRLDKRVRPARDRRPALLLSGSRRGERALEPGPSRLAEDREGVHRPPD